MRVLHMVPDIGVANGIMSVVLNFAKAMPPDVRFDVVYFHETETTRKADIEALGGRVFKIDKPPKSDALKALLHAHKGEWQALHIHAPHFAVFIAPLAKREGIKKICVHCHSTEFSLKGNGKRNELLSRYAKYNVKDKFACSKLAGNYWYGNKPYTVINNAIDCAKYRYDASKRAAVREAMGLQDCFVVGHIGKTDIPQKNHSFLLTVFAEICKIKSNAVLLLMGGEETAELKAQCRDLNIESKVHFLGFRNDIPELLQACDVFLFPSTREGLPVSVIEAQAAGVPVLMSDSVTDECAVTDLVRTKPLTENASVWAEQCVTLSAIPHTDTYETMYSAGWDLASISATLMSYYGG